MLSQHPKAMARLGDFVDLAPARACACDGDGLWGEVRANIAARGRCSRHKTAHVLPRETFF